MSFEIPLGNTTEPLPFLLIDEADHLTGLTGLLPTVTLRKPGGSFDTPSGAVSEVGNGWYEIAADADDADTLGPLILHAEAGGADPADTLYRVVTPLADQVWDEVLDGTHHESIATAGGFLQRQASFAEGTVQGATDSTVVLDSFMSDQDDYYNDGLIGITTGTGLQQLRIIVDYDGASRTCTLASDRPWIVTPETGVSTWEIYTNGPTSVTNVSNASVTSIGAPITNELTTINNIVSGATPADIWAFAARTLTQSAAQTLAAVSGSALTWLRGDVLAQSLTGLGTLAGRTRLVLTIKRDLDDADADALLQIEESDGVLVWMGAVPEDILDGSLIVDDEDAGDVTLALAGSLMAQLPVRTTLHYDIQMILDGEPVTVTQSTCRLQADVTRATA
jgi:hypothetical protein